MPVLKSLPQWPDPQESIGRQIPSSRVGKRSVWWPQGPALEAFEKHIEPAIENHLLRIDPGHVDLFIRLYMIGRKPENANPFVMICCTNRKARDIAEAAIRESGLLDEHRGFGLGAAALPLEHPAPVRRLSPQNGADNRSAGDGQLNSTLIFSESISSFSVDPLLHSLAHHAESPFGKSSSMDEAPPLIVDAMPSSTGFDISNTSSAVFSSTTEPLIGRRIYISNNNRESSLDYQYATAGVVIRVGEDYYQLTAGHLFEAENRSLDNTNLSLTSLEECRFDGQSENDEYDSEDESEVTGPGSVTSEETISWNGSAGDSTTSGETVGDLRNTSPARKMHDSNNKDAEILESLSNTDPEVAIGYLPLGRSFRSPIDYAVIALLRSSVVSAGWKINAPKPHLHVTGIAEVGYKECSIIVITHSAIVPGVLLLGEIAYRNYRTQKFEKLFQVQLTKELFEGDCGSPVIDDSTGMLYGHIIMGVPGTKLAYITQALDIFLDIETKVGKPARIVIDSHMRDQESLTDSESPDWPSQPLSRFIDSKYSMSSVSARTIVASVFSHDSTTSSSVSTVDGPAKKQSHSATPDRLPCEFVGYGNCGRSFPLDDIDNWIGHIVSDHLQGELPEKATCWFCDEFLFDSKRVGDRRLNFDQRMRHIRDHFVGGNVSVQNMRPDYYFNEHLRSSRLIPEQTYHNVRRYAEVPQPNWILSLDEGLPDQLPRDSRSQYEYSNPHDEERLYRRHRNRHGKSRK